MSKDVRAPSHRSARARGGRSRAAASWLAALGLASFASVGLAGITQAVPHGPQDSGDAGVLLARYVVVCHEDTVAPGGAAPGGTTLWVRSADLRVTGAGSRLPHGDVLGARPGTDPIAGFVSGPAPGVLTDPRTGLVADRGTGLVTDPDTGLVTDPVTGLVTNPITGVVTDPLTGSVLEATGRTGPTTETPTTGTPTTGTPTTGTPTTGTPTTGTPTTGTPTTGTPTTGTPTTGTPTTGTPTTGAVPGGTGGLLESGAGKSLAFQAAAGLVLVATGPLALLSHRRSRTPRPAARHRA